MAESAFGKALEAFQHRHAASIAARKAQLPFVFPEPGTSGAWKCDFCTRTFDNERGLKRHRHACLQALRKGGVLAIQGRQFFTCDKCSLAFDSARNLQRHSALCARRALGAPAAQLIVLPSASVIDGAPACASEAPVVASVLHTGKSSAVTATPIPRASVLAHGSPVHPRAVKAEGRPSSAVRRKKPPRAELGDDAEAVEAAVMGVCHVLPEQDVEDAWQDSGEAEVLRIVDDVDEGASGSGVVSAVACLPARLVAACTDEERLASMDAWVRKQVEALKHGGVITQKELAAQAGLTAQHRSGHFRDYMLVRAARKGCRRHRAGRAHPLRWLPQGMDMWHRSVRQVRTKLLRWLEADDGMVDEEEEEDDDTSAEPPAAKRPALASDQAVPWSPAVTAAVLVRTSGSGGAVGPASMRRRLFTEEEDALLRQLVAEQPSGHVDWCVPKGRGGTPGSLDTGG